MTQDGDRESWNLWEAVGGLRANVQRLIEGQQRLERGLADTNERLDRGLKDNNDGLERGLRETNRRVDRLLYAVIGVGGGVMVLLILEAVRSL